MKTLAAFALTLLLAVAGGSALDALDALDAAAGQPPTVAVHPLRAGPPTDTVRLPRSSPRLVGRVWSATGTPVAGAAVVVPELGIETVTDDTGHYVLELPDGAAGRRVTVRVRAGGYAHAERSVRLSTGSTVVDITLVVGAAEGEESSPSSDRSRVGPVHPVPAAAEMDVDALRLTGQAAAPGPGRFESHRPRLPGRHRPDWNTEAYDHVAENPFLAVGPNPLSTFSIDVDRASYANVRRFLRDGALPPADAVRIEELVNYFSYDDPAPGEGEAPFRVTTEVAPAPWQPLHRLVRIALKARTVDVSDIPPSNLVFLVDVSGSMQSPDKLPLLKRALGMLVEELRPEDRVALVVYAGAAGLVLESTPGSEKRVIRDALERLHAGGSTAGGAGIRLAYEVAARNHVEGGNNRVILATDGDFNVGASSDGEMIRLVEEKREQGTFLTVLGFGTGNLKDAKMEKLADHGNGNFAYIDGPLEARKVLVSEMGGTLLTVAKDVKIQVEFNPARVAGYRLIGYENRLLAAEDFDDDRKDAGEIGAGHSVVALYEVVPVGVEGTVDLREPEELRYREGPRGAPVSGADRPGHDAERSDELLYVKLRYKAPDAEVSTRFDHAVVDRGEDDLERASDDFRFAAAVAAWGMLLRESEHGGDFGFDDVARLARSGLGPDREGYRAEMLSLVGASARLAGSPASGERR